MTNKPIVKYQTYLFLLIGLLVLIGTYLFIGNSSVSAQVISQQVNISYPIPELGSCRDAKECYLYCEIPANQSLCQNFARSHGLSQILGAQTATYPKVLQATTSASLIYPITKLGSCGSFDSCRDYCQDEANRESCKNFAQSHQLLKAIGKITFPIPELGNCASRENCRDYCQEEANRESCRDFARTHGIRVRKLVHLLLQKAQDELGCSSLEECKSYCQDPANQVSCRSFGLKHRQVNRLRQLEHLDSLPSEATPGAIRQTIQNTLRNRLQSRPSTPSSTNR